MSSIIIHYQHLHLSDELFASSDNRLRQQTTTRKKGANERAKRNDIKYLSTKQVTSLYFPLPCSIDSAKMSGKMSFGAFAAWHGVFLIKRRNNYLPVMTMYSLSVQIASERDKEIEKRRRRRRRSRERGRERRETLMIQQQLNRRLINKYISHSFRLHHGCIQVELKEK